MAQTQPRPSFRSKRLQPIERFWLAISGTASLAFFISERLL